MKKNYFLFSSMMVIMLTVMAFTNNAKAQLYVNEFLASNDASFPGPQGDYPDWIEIYNAGIDDVMLGGYYMYDTLDVNEAYMIPAIHPDSVTVAAGGFLVFYANGNPESSVMNLDFKLKGGGEQIGFWTPDQSVVDSLSYDAQTSDISYGRYMDGTDNWYAMVDITPGSANTDPNLTPVEVELCINEFMASNDDALPGPQGDYPDWIEIYNAGTEAVNLSGYYMYDTLDVNEAYMIPATHPDSVTVAAGGFLVFYANGNSESSVMNLDFKLKGGGEQIGFWTPDMAVIDTLTYTAQMADTSYGRYTDGSENWYLMTEYTPGAANVYNPGPVEVELFINEFMASNDFAFPGPEGDYPDWIEIYNAGSEDVMLGGYYMYDALDVTVAYQIPDTQPDSVTVAAGGFIVFYANGSPATSVMNLDFKLKGEGEQIGFWAPDMAVIDTLTYTEQIADTSYGRYPDGSEEWFMMPNYTPGASNQPVAINEISNNVTDMQNYPNPFNTETNIQFTLENSDNVIVRLYDARGALIKVLADGNFQTGTHSINWSAADMEAGYYFYTLQTSTNFLSRKALIVK